MQNYRPQLFLRTADITVSLTFPEGTADADEKMVCRLVCFLLTVALILHIRSCQATMLSWSVTWYTTLRRKLGPGMTLFLIPVLFEKTLIVF